MIGRSDVEALHDLRVSLRRMRSLLRPLRGLPWIDPLEKAAAAMGQLSTPLRDDEVLLQELESLGRPDLVGPRLELLEAGRDALLASAEWRQLCAALVAWPSLWRQALRDGELHGLSRQIRHHQARQAKRLAKALRDPAHDRHRLRLLIKRVRYGAEAYPDQVDFSDAEPELLKIAQTELGEWHDRVQYRIQKRPTQPAAWRR